jgi:hypothetical protein
MFTIDTPKTFNVGETIDCRINGEPSQITWKNADTLVIEPNDPRAVLNTRIDGESRIFFCGHAGATKDQYAWEWFPKEGAPRGGIWQIREDQVRQVMTKAR